MYQTITQRDEGKFQPLPSIEGNGKTAENTREYYPPVVARLSSCGVFLIIEKCPFCGRRHCHGAGGGYGHRWAHCVRANGESVKGYILVTAA